MRITSLFVVVMCWMLWPSLAAAQAGCASWNTPEFFQTATAEDVMGCIASGANVRARYDDTDLQPLHLAAINSISPAVIEVLLDAGADLEDQVGGWTPLHAAALFSTSTAVIEMLLDAGADPKVEDSLGQRLWDLVQLNDVLKGTDAYQRLSSTPETPREKLARFQLFANCAPMDLMSLLQNCRTSSFFWRCFGELLTGQALLPVVSCSYEHNMTDRKESADVPA